MRSLAFAEVAGFNYVITNVQGAPLIAHIPFHLSDDSQTLELDHVKSNSIARAIKDGATLEKLMITGPHGYISPD